MWIIIVIAGLVFGLFAFSQIVYPLVSAWPRAKKLEHEGKLKKSIPIAHIFLLHAPHRHIREAIASLI